MPNRPAVLAGAWYPGDTEELRLLVDGLLAKARGRAAAMPPPPGGRHAAAPLPRAVIVPHAGLAYSGPTAALAYARLAAAWEAAGHEADCLYLFGAAHQGTAGGPEVWPEGRWETPLGDLEVDSGAARLLADEGLARPGTRPHGRDNALELQLPFVARLFPAARIVPVAVPPDGQAEPLGRAAWIQATRLGRRVIAVGSTDLTHYGAAFGVMPAGRGPGAVAWTRANSKPFLGALETMDWPAALAAARRDGSACGAGAAVAAGAFAQAAGATRGTLLEHATSAEITGETASAEHLVGYAAMIYG